ncbi:glycoside hydrolase family 3 protein [Streptomyces pseudovenezuelae]|uniref:Energy-coupling factor transporter ATP-binding protein EcfA2 n=1 Tax=Streptomyces pseudovenezuelae TaxID=67350 RepID=A0ABT6LVK8_9ACTN|nr:fibronectin type III-like domain-contianing protein [Streptomyces pseudovenezuelae]MDH6220353.1 energy-coupling factor transporter ATP-binding protein EcfA2 [Streptomyces pseudovenezuelae]
MTGTMNGTPKKELLAEPLLVAEDVVVEYPAKGWRKPPFRVLKRVSITIGAGETLGLVGESGSGKTTLGRAVLGLVPVASGTVRYRGKVISGLGAKERRALSDALADVLLGVREPGGRLPTVWPASERGLPATEPVDGVLAYDEGLFIGYRGAGRAGWQPPRYDFGHGLGYTTWDYVSIDVPGEVPSGADLTVEIRIRNSGTRHGKEVVQVYAGRPDGTVERPVRWLAGFAVVEASAGEEVVATVTVDARALRHWDTESGGWAVEPGSFRLAAGPSSTTLPLTADIAVDRG